MKRAGIRRHEREGREGKGGRKGKEVTVYLPQKNHASATDSDGLFCL